MNSLFIKDFRFGLDTRKSELTQKPGSLEVLNNGFVNQGGEVENRKAFVRTARVAGSFGLQATAAGLYTFGSSDLSGSHPLNIGTVGTPIYVNFQRLQHPAVLFDSGLYSAGSHAMTGANLSTQFRGLSAVVATFADGNKFLYYNGSLVRDFTDGLLLAHLSTNGLLAEEIENLVNRTGVYSAVAAGTIVTVTGPLGEVYQIAATKNDAVSGDITALVNNTPTAPASANPATGSFRITGGSAAAGTNTITKVEVQQVSVRQTISRQRSVTHATLEIGTGHGITAGMLIDVFGIPNYNVVGATVTSVTATTVTWANTVGIEANTADATGSVRAGTPITITNAAVDWVTNNSVTATDVAASINAATTSPEYTAIATDNLVTIQAATSEGDTPNGFEVKVTTAGNVCIGDAVFQFVGTGMSITSFNVDGADIMTAAYLEFPAVYLTINSFVAAIAADIRSGSATHGYTAFASGPLLSVSKTTTSSKDVPLDVFVTLAGAGGINSPTPGSGVIHIGGGVTSLPQMDVTVKPRLAPPTGSGSGTALPYGYTFEADINGGVAPYTYTWLLSMPSDGSFYKSGLTSETAVGRTNHFNEPIYATVSVTDSLGTITTSPQITVQSA